MNWDLVGISVEQQGDPNYSNENLSFSYGQTNRVDALLDSWIKPPTHTHARTHTFPRKANDQYSLKILRFVSSGRVAPYE